MHWEKKSWQPVSQNAKCVIINTRCIQRNKAAVRDNLQFVDFNLIQSLTTVSIFGILAHLNRVNYGGMIRLIIKLSVCHEGCFNASGKSSHNFLKCKVDVYTSPYKHQISSKMYGHFRQVFLFKDFIMQCFFWLIAL